MKKLNNFLLVKHVFIPKILLTSFLLFFFLFNANPVNAQGNLKAGQWKEAGGEKLLSGEHKFTVSWATNIYALQVSKWWPGGFWDPEDTRQYTPWEDEVKNSVTAIKGQITVQGPGNVGLFQKGKGGSIYFIDTNTEAIFTPWTNSLSWQYDKWFGTVNDYNPAGEFWGFVPAGTEITLDIQVNMTRYSNLGGNGEISYNAPQDVEYEIWFFPREGGKVISVTSSSGSGKPMPGDLYYTEKECK